MGAGAERYRGVVITQRGQRWRWELRLNGSRIRPSFNTLEEAKQSLDGFLRRREMERRRTSPAVQASLPIGELLDRWFLWKKPVLAPATSQQYGIHIRVHIKPGLGDVDANTIRPRELEAFYRTLRWKSAKESHNILRQAFAWGVLNDELVRDGNPTLVARPSRRSSTDHDGFYDDDKRIKLVDEKEIPTRAELDKLLIDAEERGLQRWWLYLKIAATTGARPGEVCALQRKHIDLVKATVRIEWSADRVGGRIKRPKTPWSVRTLQVSRGFLESILPLLPDDPEEHLFPSNTQPGAHSPLPCWNSRSVKRRLDAALARTGLPHYTPHALRHYVATHLLDRGRQPLQVARYLGHSDDTEVRNRYANHIVDDSQRQIGESAGDLI